MIIIKNEGINMSYNMEYIENLIVNDIKNAFKSRLTEKLQLVADVVIANTVEQVCEDLFSSLVLDKSHNIYKDSDIYRLVLECYDSNQKVVFKKTS